jgi:hypothetical protein
MDSGKQVTQYLEELAKVLIDLQVQVPFHMVITGGAYMLLHDKRKFTDDIDFAIVKQPQISLPSKQIFRVTVINAEVSRSHSTVPFAAALKQAVLIIAQRYSGLAKDWFNDEAAEYYYDDAPQPDVTFWRSFENILYVYLPTLEYIFATKIAAYRPKDAKDIMMLMQDLKITKRTQAKAIIDRFLLPQAQEFWQVEDNLDTLFP